MDNNNNNNNINNTDTEKHNRIFNNTPNITVDNRIVESKTRINLIDEKLDVEKKKIKKLSDMQDTVNSIAKSMDRCIDLLSKSISGSRTYNKFSDMRNSNKLFLRKATSSIEEESMIVRKKINELYKEKDTVLKENRDRYHKEMAIEEELKAEEAAQITPEEEIKSLKKVISNKKDEKEE